MNVNFHSDSEFRLMLRMSVQRHVLSINMSKHVAQHVFEVGLFINMLQIKVNMCTLSHQSNVSAYY